MSKPAPIDPTAQGITALCESGTASGITGEIVVNNLSTGNVKTITIDPNTTAAGMCSKVNITAQSAGFETSYSDPNGTAVQIYGNPSTIQLKCAEVQLVTQSFQTSTQSTGPLTDCTPQ